jgi:hypothetical protein
MEKRKHSFNIPAVVEVWWHTTGQTMGFATHVYDNELSIMLRIQVIMAVSMKMTVFCDVAPCSLVEVYWCLLHPSPGWW